MVSAGIVFFFFWLKAGMWFSSFLVNGDFRVRNSKFNTSEKEKRRLTDVTLAYYFFFF